MGVYIPGITIADLESLMICEVQSSDGSRFLEVNRKEIHPVEIPEGKLPIPKIRVTENGVTEEGWYFKAPAFQGEPERHSLLVIHQEGESNYFVFIQFSDNAAVEILEE